MDRGSIRGYNRGILIRFAKFQLAFILVFF